MATPSTNSTVDAQTKVSVVDATIMNENIIPVVPPLPGRAGSTLDIAASWPISRNALKKRIREAREEIIAPLWRERRKQQRAARRDTSNRRSHPRPPEDAIPPIDITLVLDCAYDDLMTDKELHSLAQQISRCYSVQKVAKCAAAGGLVLTSYGDRLDAQMKRVSPNAHRWQNYRCASESYTELFPLDKLVYLSADADTVLDTLEPDMVYIIGALVDRNHHKNLTHKRATELGIKTAQLPIGSFIATSHRRVLTVNHVVEILTHWCGYRDWQQAFLTTIPQRKLTQSPTMTTTTTTTTNSTINHVDSPTTTTTTTTDD
ncbi:guanine-1-methyltransferase-domain-containing protein [Syncephalis plumigaleata]|nr:guanine-1-methyltransferase-domain-containing protein [Syncephalis plumigaleata]